MIQRLKREGHKGRVQEGRRINSGTPEDEDKKKADFFLKLFQCTNLLLLRPPYAQIGRYLSQKLYLKNLT
jgi:hypothetical protein